MKDKKPSPVFPLSIRLSPAVFHRLQAATDRKKHPFAPRRSAVIERGIELALVELDNKRGKK